MRTPWRRRAVPTGRVPGMGTLADGEADPGLVMAGAAKARHTVADFIAALGQRRHPERELALAKRQRRVLDPQPTCTGLMTHE